MEMDEHTPSGLPLDARKAARRTTSAWSGVAAAREQGRAPERVEGMRVGVLGVLVLAAPLTEVTLPDRSAAENGSLRLSRAMVRTSRRRGASTSLQFGVDLVATCFWSSIAEYALYLVC